MIPLRRKLSSPTRYYFDPHTASRRWSRCRRRDLLILSIITICFVLWFHAHTPGLVDPRFGNGRPAKVNGHGPGGAYDRTGDSGWQHHSGSGADVWDGPANATLGFGHILAVSRSSSPRKESLTLAANLTGLEITVPDQPAWTDEDIENMKARKGSIIEKGSAMAWLGHLNALKWFLSTSASTALILEDDVDWDIHIRAHQIPAAAKAMHELLEPPSPLLSFKRLTRPSGDYWPSPSSWELLYLGHCGDPFTKENLNLPHTTYIDSTVPPAYAMHSETNAYLSTLNLPSSRRVLHKSVRPLCSFAYAVTRSTAQKILGNFSHEAEDGGTWAYDVRILEACRDLGYNCFSVNPELFHHMDKIASEIEVVTGHKITPPDMATKEEEVEGSPEGLIGAEEKPREAQGDDEPLRDEHQPHDADQQHQQQREEHRREEKPKTQAPGTDSPTGTPNIACGVRELVDAWGSRRDAWDVVRRVGEMEGLCLIDGRW